MTMQTLEEMQDAKAYAVKTYRKKVDPEGALTLAAMKALAARESKSVPGGTYKPRAKTFKDVVSRKEYAKSRADRVLDALSSGPLTRRELAAAIDVSYPTTGDYLRPLINDGRVLRMGWEGRTEKFGLAK